MSGYYLLAKYYFTHSIHRIHDSRKYSFPERKQFFCHFSYHTPQALKLLKHCRPRALTDNQMLGLQAIRKKKEEKIPRVYQEFLDQVGFSGVFFFCLFLVWFVFFFSSPSPCIHQGKCAHNNYLMLWFWSPL